MNKLWTLCKKSLYFFSSYLTQEDMSRMGRDYLKVGYYTESFFAERGIRYIAINDGVDSDKGDNEFTPFRNLFNDFMHAIRVRKSALL